MKVLADRANLIPVLSKADSLTEAELDTNRHQIMMALEEHNIQVYDFVSETEESDTEIDVREEFPFLQLLQKNLPFSLIGRNLQDKPIRKTPWGDIDISDQENCNFTLLKNVIFGSHIHEFKEATIKKKYEAYRIRQLSTREET